MPKLDEIGLRSKGSPTPTSEKRCKVKQPFGVTFQLTSRAGSQKKTQENGFPENGRGDWSR